MKKLSAMLLIVLLLMPGLVLADTQTHGNVTAKLFTGKQTYAADEEITSTVSVINNSRYPLGAVSLECISPAGYTVKDGSESNLSIADLKMGQNAQLLTVHVPYRVPLTGDDFPLWRYLLLLMAGIGGLILLLRGRKGRSTMALLLCFAILGSLALPADALAKQLPPKGALRSSGPQQNETVTMNLSETVQAGGKDVTIHAVVIFTILAGDNLNDDTIDMGDIEMMIEDGTIEVTFGYNGELLVVDGTFTDDPVNNTAQAADVLNKAGSLFGPYFHAEANQITMDQTAGLSGRDDVTYRYQPMVDGYEVLGSQVVLFADTNGVVHGFANSYDPQINEISTSASITEQQAIETARADFANGDFLAAYIAAAITGTLTDEEVSQIAAYLSQQMSADSKLIVMANDGVHSAALVYEIILHSDEENENTPFSMSMAYYIYANGEHAGEIMYTDDMMEDAGGWDDSVTMLSGIDWKNKTVSFPANQNSNGIDYRLRDGGRKIAVYTAQPAYRNIEPIFISLFGHSILVGFTYDKCYNGTPGNIYEFTLNDINQEVTKEGVSLINNFAKTYDFYKNILNRKSFDGNSSEIPVTMQFTEWPEDPNMVNGKYYNAYWTWWPESQFVFGEGRQYACGLDVVGHEFTHGVVHNTCRLKSGSGLESNTLNEALADIMGTLIEGVNGLGRNQESRWQMGEDTGRVSRSLENPGSVRNYPDHYANADFSEPHYSASIFGHAFYLMVMNRQCSGITDEQWAECYYRTIKDLTDNATFLMARGVVIKSAKAMGFTASQLQAIRKAFDDVGICNENTMRIVLTWGVSPSDLDSHLVGPSGSGSRFHVYFDDKDARDQHWRLLAELDYDDVTSYGPEVVTIYRPIAGETYYYYVHDYTNRDSTASTAMAQSGAVVKVFYGTRRDPEKTYTINPNKSGKYWTVFSLKYSGNNCTFVKLDKYSEEALYQ